MRTFQLFLLTVLLTVSCGGPSRPTGDDHKLDLSSLTEVELAAERERIQADGAEDLRDLRLFSNELRRLPDDVHNNKQGSRVAVWKYGENKDLAITVVDRKNGALDNASVVWNPSNSAIGLEGLVHILILADAFSSNELDKEEVTEWLVNNAMKLDEKKFFGGCFVEIYDIQKTRQGALILVRIS